MHAAAEYRWQLAALLGLVYALIGEMGERHRSPTIEGPATNFFFLGETC